jgi:hypothetical protein
MKSKTGAKCPFLLRTLSAHFEVWRYNGAFVGTQLNRYNHGVQSISWNEGNPLLFIFKANAHTSPSTCVGHNASVNSNMLYIQLMHFLLMPLLQPFLYVFIQLTSSAFSIDQKMMCPIQFQSLFVFLDLPNNLLLNKLEKRRRSISLFQTIQNRKCIRQKFTSSDSTTGFV